MKRTLRKIGLGALVVFAVLAMAWAFEQAPSSSHMRGEAIDEPASQVPPQPSFEPAAVDSNQEYDRSDLQLSQG
jgi:hypothetical protein